MAAPGQITDDTTLRHYMCLAMIRKGGRITPDDYAKVWLNDLNPLRLFFTERIVLEKLKLGMNPWETGRGQPLADAAIMAVAPVGIINAGDPEQAFQDAFNLSSIHQDGVERDAAATAAAGFAAAFAIGATPTSVLDAMVRYSSFDTGRLVAIGRELAAETGDVDRFTEQFYLRYLDRSFPRPPAWVWDKDRTVSPTSREVLPIVAGLFELCGGEPAACISAGASFGRDADTIATVLGGLSGALSGASAIPADWIAQSEAANVAFFDEVSPDARSDFRSHRRSNGRGTRGAARAGHGTARNPRRAVRRWMTVSASPQVMVLGSINMDAVLRVARFPTAGETIAAHGFARHPGGKGANQAVAAARAGATVGMIGTVGDDADGAALLDVLRREAIDCRYVRVDRGMATGTAYVLVDDAGENQIVVHGGANLALEVPPNAVNVVALSQLESPLVAVAAFLADRSAGSIGILNAAPHRADGVAIFAQADIVVLNQTELAAYCGASAVPVAVEEVVALARSLLQHATQRIVVTLGAAGSVTVDSDAAMETSAAPADVVDTTGAGDCFCGYLAAHLAQGGSLADAVAVGHRAAALAVAHEGAIPSVPFLADLAPA